ncbi:MAG: hypothetical protein KAS32_05090 [Candidatus Peribacteraceae bacterium]|nr:hypothetical protein [Candidatus Peribacteraceae bacterium]
MNVYDIDIWRSVHHGDKFSHNATRYQLVHALNEERAKRKVILAEEKTWENGSLVIRASSEVIYSIRKAGTVTKHLFYVYSDGRTSRPVR